jgi:ligand-binding SRPBCC domain-containing protein
LRVFSLDSEQFIAEPREAVFAFFADARNLERITPAWLSFELLGPGPVAMAEGTTLDYRLRLHGIPLRWRSEITAWEPPRRFVDVQIRGPYRLWEHEHAFEERAGGTVVVDRVRYAVPGGALVNRLLVRRDVERIFAYRGEALKGIFAVEDA